MRLAASLWTSLAATAVAVAGLVGLAACDAAPGPNERLRNQRPVVSDLTLAPDTVEVAALPDAQVSDTLVRVPFELGVRAQDPDGTVQRVLFTLEPTEAPAQTLQGELPAQGGMRYAQVGEISLPNAAVLYTVRVFAVDDDGQAGNQARGLIRILPDTTAGAEAAHRPAH